MSECVAFDTTVISNASLSIPALILNFSFLSFAMWSRIGLGNVHLVVLNQNLEILFRRKML